MNKKPAWLAMTASEYAGKQEDTSNEADELESQRDEINVSSDGEDVQVSATSKIIDMQLILVRIVQVAKNAKDKGKSVSSCGRDKKKRKKQKVLDRDEDSSSGKGDSRGWLMLHELPKEVHTLVNRANVFLRVILSLEMLGWQRRSMGTKSCRRSTRSSRGPWGKYGGSRMIRGNP